MTRFLASVRSAEEAAVALAGGADIIDAKEPAAGALGRVDPGTLRAILAAIAGTCPVSATIGDMPLEPLRVAAAVERMAADGADIVKIGMFDGAVEETLAALRPIASRGVRLVAVLFADRAPDIASIVARCSASGFFGVMLDTGEKTGGPLGAHLSAPALAEFVALARGSGLASGLAGSLRVGDVAALVPLGADYLGFRSALTAGARADALDVVAVRRVRRAIDQALSASSSATEAAGAMSHAASASASLAPGSTISSPR
jgi:uncharacterized protein (UPF0264 family)